MRSNNYVFVFWVPEKKNSQIVKHAHSSKDCLFLVCFSFTWCIADKSGRKFLFFYLFKDTQ